MFPLNKFGFDIYGEEYLEDEIPHIKMIKKTTLLSDIVYNPKETGFLSSFTENKKIYGISMLIEQAALSFKIWLGFKPCVDKKLVKILDKIITWQ